MKTFRTTLLAAAAIGAVVPALAHAQDVPPDRAEHARDRGGDHGGDRDNRGGDRGARPDGGQRPDRAPQPQPAPQAQAQPQIRSQDVQRQPAPQAPQDRGNGQNRQYGRFAPGQPGGNFDNRNDRNGNDRNLNDRRGYSNDRNAPQSPGRPDRPNGFDSNRQGYDRSNGNWQRSGDYGRPGGNDWRGREWRQDRRYDWQGYRNQNRSLFRAPRYYAPRGWAYGYRRFDIGFRLPPFLFGSEYWIADPWAYRLPPVDGPYRWVRYYNDVLLIDLRSGAVVDEIPGFFW